MGIGSTLAAVSKIPGDFAKSAVNAVKSASTGLQTLSQLSQEMGGNKVQSLKPTSDFAKAAMNTVTLIGSAMVGSKLAMASKSAYFVKTVRHETRVGCNETVHQLRPFPKGTADLLTANRIKVSEILLKEFEIKKEIKSYPNTYFPSQEVQVGCSMTMHVAPDFSAQRVVDRLWSDYAIQRIVSPSLMAMILRESDRIANRHSVEVGCSVYHEQSISQHPSIKTLRRIEYAFAPITGVLSYLSEPIVDFFRAQ